MAYTNSPQFQTYRTEAVPFVGNAYYRSGDLSINRDMQIINMFYDRIGRMDQKAEVRLQKRPGLSATNYSLTKSSNSAIIRGSFYDVDQNAFYWAVDNQVFSVRPDVGPAVRTVTSLLSSSGYVGFCSYIKGDNTRFVCIATGNEFFVDNYATNTCTKVTDPDLPVPHQPYPIYIDGYILLIKKDTGDIYNSVVDNPLSWVSDNFISAEISSDFALRLFKVKNYLVAMGSNSIEYFWDAGNPTGSPFSRNDSPTRNIGYVTGGVLIGETVFFVGQDNNKSTSVYAVNSFKVEKVSNTVVDKTIQTLTNTNNVKAPLNLNTDGFGITIGGHDFYVLVTPQTTWVYDVDEKIWYEWRDSFNGPLRIEAVWGMYNGATYVAIAGQSHISIFSPDVYQDFGVSFTCRYTTEKLTFGTGNWKVLNKLYVEASRHQQTGTSNLQVSWSDSDWANTGSTLRNINLFSPSPYTTKCGKFRNRSFRVEYTDNYPFHISGLFLDINIMGH